MRSAIRKIRNNQPNKTIEEVSLSFDGESLIFLFENGEGYKVRRKNLPFDDGSPITRIELYDHGCAAAIYQACGSMYELPWDSIRYYAKGGKRKSLSLGKKIATLRKQQKLTQSQLAWRSGLSRMQLSRIEKEKSEPGLETTEKLARALGMSLGELVSV